MQDEYCALHVFVINTMKKISNFIMLLENLKILDFIPHCYYTVKNFKVKLCVWWLTFITWLSPYDA